MKLNFKNVFLSVGMFVFALGVFGLVSNKAEAVGVTCTAIASGDWSNTLTWDDGCNANAIPLAADAVVIPSGYVVTVAANTPATSVTLNDAVLNINSGVTLSVSGAVTLSATTSGINDLTVAGTLAANSVAIIGGASTGYSGIRVHPSGSLSVATNVVLSGTPANARLTSEGTGAKTISITGNLINGGTVAYTGTVGTSTVTGTTTISDGATMTLSDITGTYTFTAPFTVAIGGIYNETVPGTKVTFSNTVENNGTMTVNTGEHIFSNTITNTGIFNYANLVTLTANDQLTDSTSGTVNYNGVDQTVTVVKYYNLTLSGSGTKVVGPLVSPKQIINNLTISGTIASLTGNSTANKLYLGTLFEKQGTHGSTSSTATYKNNTYFAGTYKVTVAVGRVTASGGGTETTITTYPYTASADTTAPSGTSVSINAGVSTTSSLSSTLTFTAIDATEMMISNDAGFAGASWESYAGSKAWTLTSGDGVKTVYAKFRDTALNMSTAVIDAIAVSGSGTVAVPNEPVQGCSAGNLFNTSTGAVCVNNAVPQGCSGGNAFNTSTGAVCTNNTVLQIPGCGNSATGFSVVDGKSCVGNHVTTFTTTYNFGTTTLKNGSKGEAVKELQRFLNAKLFLGLVVDGSLGPKTIIVIKKWQKDNGLVSDGLVGAKTKAMMNN